MGKAKQTKEKKFNRNVEISNPILDPEIIKAIHSPPKGQRLDIKHGGFKALLSDLNSQDSTDELTPLNENHVPSYIGISCAVSGYSGYSSYNNHNNNSNNLASKITDEDIRKSRLTTRQFGKNSANSAVSPNRSSNNSPVIFNHPPVRHIKLDKTNTTVPDEERKELTEKLTASAAEYQRRSPSPCIPPTEGDRHHGTYIGARYCPMPPPSKLVNKHIPLLGIDDDIDPDEYVDDDGKKVEQKIASLYGEEYVDTWRESVSHKAKKELDANANGAESVSTKSPKDLVTLKPAPANNNNKAETINNNLDTVAPDVKVFAGVEKNFLNKLLTDENPPKPSPPSSPIGQIASNETAVQSLEKSSTPVSTTRISSEKITVSPPPMSPSPSPSQDYSEEIVQSNSSVIPEHNVNNDETTKESVSSTTVIRDERDLIDSPSSPILNEIKEENLINYDLSPTTSPEPINVHDNSHEMEQVVEDIKIESTEPSQSQQDIIRSYVGEESIEYEIRTQSPVDNQSSPERMPAPPASETNPSSLEESTPKSDGIEIADENLIVSLESNLEGQNPMEVAQETLVSLSPEPSTVNSDAEHENQRSSNQQMESLIDLELSPESGAVKNQGDNISEHETTPKNADTKEISDVIDYVENPPVERVETKSEDQTVEVEPKVDDLNESVEVEEKSKSDEVTVQDGHYYLDLLEHEKSFINSQVARAEKLLEERESELDEDSIGRIRSAIGKANLLMNKKCNQFKELCENNINSAAGEQYAVLNDDLTGFWDMISIQITEVRDLFSKLSL